MPINTSNEKSLLKFSNINLESIKISPHVCLKQIYDQSSTHNISFQWHIFSSYDFCGPNECVCVCHPSLLLWHFSFYTSTHPHKNLEIAESRRLTRKTKCLSFLSPKFYMNNHIGLFPKVICIEGFVSLWPNWELCYWISGQMVKQSVYQVITMFLTFIRCYEMGQRIRRHYSCNPEL